jgi:hypothetical protein
MAMSTYLARSIGVASLFAVVACAEGTGTPFTPTLPTTTTSASNADGTLLKASAPVPQTPAADAQIANLRPTLAVSTSAGTNAQLSMNYIFQLYEGDTLVRQTDGVSVAADQVTWLIPADLLKHDTTYRWRARGLHTGIEGPWSSFATFRTPPAPPPSDSSSPGPVPCAGSTGPEIIACVAAAYPERLVATSAGDFSDERRHENMEFMRDRVIETGKCKGMDLGLNNKRGGPEISRDFIVWRSDVGKNGRDRGVDIASGYDDTKTKLKLTWQVFKEDRNWGHPFYRNYGPVDCSSVQ